MPHFHRGTFCPTSFQIPTNQKGMIIPAFKHCRPNYLVLSERQGFNLSKFTIFFGPPCSRGWVSGPKWTQMSWVANSQRKTKIAKPRALCCLNPVPFTLICCCQVQPGLLDTLNLGRFIVIIPSISRKQVNTDSRNLSISDLTARLRSC